MTNLSKDTSPSSISQPKYYYTIAKNKYLATKLNLSEFEKIPQNRFLEEFLILAVLVLPDFYSNIFIAPHGIALF
jgi:hypothetical protein